jgi:hypothetical protein
VELHGSPASALPIDEPVDDQQRDEQRDCLRCFGHMPLLS